MPEQKQWDEIGQSAQVDDLPIGVLHLGVKTATLEQAGFRTVGDLKDITGEQIAQIPTVGRRTADLLFKNRNALLTASVSEKGIDWDRYCEVTDLPLLPQLKRPNSGKAFLACLPDLFANVADNLEDETLSIILRKRICQPPDQQMTLDEIAMATNPPITRERVRQKEKKLLGQLTGGLLNDTYGTLKIHFRPEFSYWWRLAAENLSNFDDIEFADLLDALSEAWDVPNDAVISQLPIILAIITGEPQMISKFRAPSRIDPKLFGVLSSDVRELPLNRLRLGRHAERLTNGGLETLGDMVTRICDGNLGAQGGITAEVAIKHANLLVSCLSTDGVFDWQSYRAANSLRTLPYSPTASAAEFVGTLRETICELLSLCQVTKRALDIYRIRTSRSFGSQMTLRGVADTLGTHLPSVKREETVFLGFLNGVLIGHNFSRLPVWLDNCWLDYWDEAQAIFKNTPDDYAIFLKNLAWHWRLTERDVSKASPTIWAVLSGYPSNRRSKRTPNKPPVIKQFAAPAPKLPDGRIRLRGFRRLH